jgi:hypothetical protein
MLPIVEFLFARLVEDEQGADDYARQAELAHGAATPRVSSHVVDEEPAKLRAVKDRRLIVHQLSYNAAHGDPETLPALRRMASDYDGHEGYDPAWQIDDGSTTAASPGRVLRTTAHRVTWNEQLLVCPECSAGDRWILTIERPDRVIGEVCWAECRNGHRLHHPLLYPDIIRTVAEWNLLPDNERHADSIAQAETGRLRGWAPSGLIWPIINRQIFARYVPWTAHEPTDRDR